VPVVRSCNHHGVQFFALEQFAEVAKPLGLVSLDFFDLRRCAVGMGPIDIADGCRDYVAVFHKLVEP